MKYDKQPRMTLYESRKALKLIHLHQKLWHVGELTYNKLLGTQQKIATGLKYTIT